MMGHRRVPLNSPEGRRLVNRGPAWREHPSYYQDEPSEPECSCPTPDQDDWWADPACYYHGECDRLHCNDPIGRCDHCPLDQEENEMTSDGRYVPSSAAQAASDYFNSLAFPEREALAPLLEHYRQMGLAEAAIDLRRVQLRIDAHIRSIRENAS